MSARLFLSRARLRSRRGEALSAIAPILLPDDDSQRTGHAHRLVWLLFQAKADAARNFLWRDDGGGRYLILSHEAPTDPNDLFELDTKPFEPKLSSGDALRFSLRVNATVARKGALSDAERASRARGKRVDVVMDALHAVPLAERSARRDQIAQDAGQHWLAGQGDKAGFDLTSCRVTACQHLDMTDRARPGRRVRGGAAVLDIEGVLAVRDPDPFLSKLSHGFGSAKAFGFGLMLIRRV